MGPNLSNKITPSNKNPEAYLDNKLYPNFTFQKITTEILFKFANKLKPKNSAGPDNISSKLLKTIIPTIQSPLIHLFNLSCKTGYIPTELKTAKVVPIYKSDEKADFTNYRPISLLPSISKLLEKIVADQMFKFLYKNNILYQHQYGFRHKP